MRLSSSSQKRTHNCMHTCRKFVQTGREGVPTADSIGLGQFDSGNMNGD